MLIFMDTETTGNGPDDRICQIAFKTEGGQPVCELFNPGMPISIEAMSIHHITNKMVQDKPPFRGSRPYQELSALVTNPGTVIVAHNAKFDVEMLNREDIYPSKVICTIKLARHLDKSGVIPKYSLQYLRYYLGIDIKATAHDALGDILVLEAVFNRIYAKFLETHNRQTAIEEMIQISANPVLMPRMPFGKHKGMRFSDIPADYLQWLLNTGLDEDLVYTVRSTLGLISEKDDFSTD